MLRIKLKLYNTSRPTRDKSDGEKVYCYYILEMYYDQNMT